LGVKNPERDKLKLLSQLYKRLVELHQAGKKAVVLIDEAQMLKSKEIMEEFRGLLNLEMPERKLITFVFFGLPEIEENLALDQPLAQRVALKYTLEPFNEESTRGYIQHRLRLAGSHEEIFDEQATQLIHRYSRGIPRLINTICDNALFEGYLLKQKKIDASLVATVVKDLGLSDNEQATSEIECAPMGTISRERPAQVGKAPKAKPSAPPQPTNNEVEKLVSQFDKIVVNEHKPSAPKQAEANKGEQEDEVDIDSLLDKLEEK
jgi:hypothetical protein